MYQLLFVAKEVPVHTQHLTAARSRERSRILIVGSAADEFFRGAIHLSLSIRK